MGEHFQKMKKRVGKKAGSQTNSGIMKRKLRDERYSRKKKKW